MEIADEIVKQLEDDEILSHWKSKAKTDDKEAFMSDLFNYFLEKNDDRDFDCLQQVSYSIFMHGLHCICWETVRDLLKK